MITNPDRLFRHAFLLGLGVGSLGLIAPQETIAQETAAGEEIAAPSVEVSAYRVPTLLSETSQGVSIVTREEIATRNPASTVELLRDVPGLYVDQVGGPGGVSNIYIRGSDPEQVLVLIDGVRVNDPTVSRGGSYDLSSVDPSDVERIEVIRGAGSAIYGADGMGGVINIVSRRATPGSVKLGMGAEAGTFGYSHIQASASGGSEKLQASLNAAKLEDGRKEDSSTLNLETFSGSLNWQIKEAAGLRVSARHNDRASTAFPDVSGGARLAQIRTLEERDALESSYGADLSLRPTDTAEVRIQVSRYERTEDINSPGVQLGANPPFFVPPAISNTDFTRNSILVSALITLPLNSAFTFGFERIREEGETRSVLDLSSVGGNPAERGDFNLLRKTRSTFGELKSKPIDNLTVQLGIRHDTPTDIASENSPSAGVRYDFPVGTAFKARYAEGFRPPSFSALGSPVALAGNPNLVSETSKGFEVGLEQPLMDNKAHIGLIWFQTEFKNLITYDANINQLVNEENVDTEGAELDMSLQAMESLRLGLNYTYVDTKILNSTNELRNRPRHRASFNARYSINDAWQIAWNTIYVGQFFDSSIPTGVVKMDSYTRTDISAAYKCKRLTATIAVDNLFGEKYEQFVGFAHPGARIRAGLSASF